MVYEKFCVDNNGRGGECIMCHSMVCTFLFKEDLKTGRGSFWYSLPEYTDDLAQYIHSGMVSVVEGNLDTRLMKYLSNCPNNTLQLPVTRAAIPDDPPNTFVPCRVSVASDHDGELGGLYRTSIHPQTPDLEAAMTSSSACGRAACSRAG